MKKRSFSQLFWLLLAVLCIAVLVLLAVQNAHAQTVAPFMGVGNVQELDNNGNVCPSCVLYSYQAGTSTQQATYTDATGLVQNPNPITFGAGGRTPIWLTIGAFYKFVLCVQNDGAFCSPGDVLFTVDQVPGGSTGSGGGGGGSPFIGIFISGSANPASTGVIRLASADTIGFRNAANSANLLLSKDTSDVLFWSGGSFKLPEAVCSNVGVTFDYLCADSTAHRLKLSGNGGGYAQAVVAGVDINNSDQVTQVHFGSTAAPFGGTPPTTNQALCWNGSQIVGCSVLLQESTFGWGVSQSLPNLTAGGCSTLLNASFCAATVFAGSRTLVRVTWILDTTPGGCVTNAVLGVRDVTASTTLYSVTINAQPTGFVDSGALSVAMTAGHTFAVGLLTPASGCTTAPVAQGLTMVYQ